MSPRHRLMLPLLALCCAASAAEFKFDAHTFTAPDDFVVERAAAPPLVERPITMAFDKTGALYVADSSGSNSAELLEVMVYDQIALQTGDVTVEMAPDEFRLTLSEDAATQLDGTVEYVVPLSGTATDVARLDEVLRIIFDGKHGGTYVRRP